MAYTLVPTELIVDGAVTSAKLDTNISISGTLGVTGELTLSTHMNMGDNDKIKIGTGGDLEIYHDGSNSYISNSTGNIYLADTNGSVHIQAKLNEESIVCTADGAVSLYHDNAVKLATTSTGIDVTSNDSTNNSVSTLLKLSHTTTGTAADGIGTRINFESEDDGGTVSTMGYIDTLFTDVSDGAEKSAIQFYTRSGGSIARQMHIDSTGVGIGTDNPDEPLHIFSTTDADLLLEGTETGTSTRFAKVAFANNISGTTTDLGAITADTDGATNSSAFKFYTADAGSVTNKMTITSGGNLLVGKDSDAFATAGVVLATSQNSSFTRNSGNVLALRRNTNDGDLVTLYKDTAKIGSIASRGGTTASFITNTASGSGAGISGSTNMVIACDETGAANGSTVSLGSTSTKWKDLYLSGTAYAVKADIDISTNARLTINDIISEVGDGNVALQAQNSGGTALKPMGFRAEDIRFATGSTEKMRIDSSGNVGIGVTNPSDYYSSDLVVSSANEQGITLAATSTSDANYLMFADGTSGDARFVGHVGYDHSADNLFLRSGGLVSFKTGGGTERMRIDSNGDIGINTDSPIDGSKLDVVDSDDMTMRVRSTGASSAAIRFQNSGTGTTTGDGLFVGIDGSANAYLWNYESTNMIFGTSNTEKMRIESSQILLNAGTQTYSNNQRLQAGSEAITWSSSTSAQSWTSSNYLPYQKFVEAALHFGYVGNGAISQHFYISLLNNFTGLSIQTIQSSSGNSGSSYHTISFTSTGAYNTRRLVVQNTPASGQNTANLNGTIYYGFAR